LDHAEDRHARHLVGIDQGLDGLFSRVRFGDLLRLACLLFNNVPVTFDRDRRVKCGLLCDRRFAVDFEVEILFKFRTKFILKSNWVFAASIKEIKHSFWAGVLLAIVIT
jgi:hypothetical protein